jgi:NitT/TauT family transport system substrate-binding protein
MHHSVALVTVCDVGNGLRCEALLEDGMRIRLLAATIAVGSLVLTGCGSDGDASASDSAGTNTVRILGVGSLDFSAIDVAKWKENLEDEGVKVDLKFIEDEADTVRSVVAGAADYYIGSIPDAVTAMENGEAPLKIVSINAQATDYVVVAKNDIESVDDLEGKTIAVNTPGSAGDTIMKLSLDREGFDTSSPKYVVIGGTSARVAALQAGQVDATVAHVAEAEAAAATGQFHILFDCGPALGPYLQSGLIGSTKFMEANPELAQKVVDAQIEAERWAMTDKEGYVKLSQEYDKEMSDDVRDKSYDKFVSLKFFGVDGGLDQSLVDDWWATAKETEAIPADVAEPSTFIDDTYVKAYLEKNGAFKG